MCGTGDVRCGLRLCPKYLVARIYLHGHRLIEQSRRGPCRRAMILRLIFNRFSMSSPPALICRMGRPAARPRPPPGGENREGRHGITARTAVAAPQPMAQIAKMTGRKPGEKPGLTTVGGPWVQMHLPPPTRPPSRGVSGLAQIYHRDPAPSQYAGDA